MHIFDNYSHEYKTRRIFELWIKSGYTHENEADLLTKLLPMVRKGRDSCGIYYTTSFRQVWVWTSNGCGGGLGCAEPPTRR